MILVLAGTKDGREIAAELSAAGYRLLVSVTSEYGKQRLAKTLQDCVNDEPLDETAMRALIKARGIKLILDASHPYALAVSANARSAAAAECVTYLRYERPAVELPEYDKLHRVDSYQAAAEVAARLGRTVFLTTGSRHLGTFLACEAVKQRRVIARVLPEAAVLQDCNKAGLQPHDIVALAGPFSKELNMALFKEYQAEVVVTKNSGEIGGSDTKIAAAMELGLSIVVLERPHTDEEALDSPATVLAQVKKEAAKWNL